MVLALRKLSSSSLKRPISFLSSNGGSLRLLSSLPSSALADSDKSRSSWIRQLNAPLEEIDPEIADIIELEKASQWKGFELIPSENFTFASVMQAVGSLMTNKYSQGYPGARYYGRNDKDAISGGSPTWNSSNHFSIVTLENQSKEPGFANYLQSDFLSIVPDEEEKSGLFLKRNKAKLSGSDESHAMEGLKIINEVDCKIACSSFKVKYEPNTADLLYRSKQKKPLDNVKTFGSSEIARKRKVSRFHITLNRRLVALP